MQCFMKKEDKRLIDVDNVETTGESAELTNTIVNSTFHLHLCICLVEAG